MAEERVTWDNFTGGEAGLEGLSNPRRPNTFSGKNVYVSSTGAVLPRPGLRRLHTPKPVPGIAVGVHSVTNILAIVSHNPSTNTLYLSKFSTDGAFMDQYSIAETTASTEDAQVIYADSTYYMTYGGFLYWITGGVLTKITTFPSSTYHQTPLVETGVRLAVGQHKVLRFSEPNDYDNWPATNFIEFPNDVTALARLGDDLIVFTLESTYALTGTLGTSSSKLFRLNDRLGVDSLNDVVASPDLVYFWSAQSRHPVVLAAGRAQAVENLEASRSVPLFGFSSPDNHGVALASGSTSDSVLYAAAYADHTGGKFEQALLFHNGIWSAHEFAVPHLPADVAGEYGTGQTFVLPSRGVDQGSVALYMFNPSVADFGLSADDGAERPGFISDRYRLPGDESYTPLDASFTLPEHWTEAGQEVRVRQVLVEFLSYQTGSETDNQITCQVETFGRRGSPGTGAQQASWSAGSAFTTTGEMLAFAMRQFEVVGSPFGGFWKVGPNTTLTVEAVA